MFLLLHLAQLFDDSTAINQPSKQPYSSQDLVYMMYFSLFGPTISSGMLAKIFFPAFVMVYYCY
jgi:hypothetical protein